MQDATVAEVSAFENNSNIITLPSAEDNTSMGNYQSGEDEDEAPSATIVKKSKAPLLAIVQPTKAKKNSSSKKYKK